MDAWPARAAGEDMAQPEGPWPRITVVTPCFNQGPYLERTIRSVLLQGYPNLEYYIMDAGSTDETVDVIRKYEPWLAGWVSEPDKGQADAINKGWARGTGELLAWINSDDWYAPGVLRAVGRAFASQGQPKWLATNVMNVWESRDAPKLVIQKPMDAVSCLGRHGYSMHQPGMFWHRDLVEAYGPFDTSLHFSFDHDFWVYALLQGFEPLCLDLTGAYFLLHDTSKTRSQRLKFLADDWKVFERYETSLTPAQARQARKWLLEQEAEVTLNYLYYMVYEGRLAEARREGLRQLRLFPHFKPLRLGPALLVNLWLGRVPEWAVIGARGRESSA
jgi:glycosyltransferase involved in cell wall biosynthesis